MTTFDIMAAADGKARCPICRTALPGRYLPGSKAVGVEFICKRCKETVKVNIRSSGQS